MRRGLKIAIAIILLLVVAAVLISPAVDLEPTALRAALWVAALFASFGIVKIAHFRVSSVQLTTRIHTKRRRLLPPPSPPLVDLYGARLC
jgi:hypothetical protein